MLVVVIAVGGVLVSIMHIIDMVTMLNSLVTTILAVSMLSNSMLCNCLVLVIVIAMQRMVVGSVHVVHMVAMLDGLVTTAFAMLVLVYAVLSMNVSVAHDR